MTHAPSLVLLIQITLIALVAGCGETESMSAGDSGTSVASDSASDALSVTYYEHIRPLFAENCVQCHSDGSIAPFALRTYEEVVRFGVLLKTVVTERTMPPHPTDNSGACNHWRDARWLTEEEIATVATWVDEGMAEGDAGPIAPEETILPVLSEVTHQVEMPIRYEPNQGGSDDYRCFVVDPGLVSDGFLTGFEVVPGEPRIVHHMILYQPSTEAASLAVEGFDAADPEPGYTCFGGIGAASTPLVLWAPGGGATEFPSDLGLEMPAGRKLVMQLHYNVLGGPGLSDQTRVNLQVRSSVARPMNIVPLADLGMSLPPRMPSVSTSQSFPVARVNGLRIYGAFPHMHTLGRELRVSLEKNGGEEQCVIHVDRWDFDWQMGYFLEEPLLVEDARSATITCTYDTRERDDVTRWGEGTQDEMCLNYLLVAP